MGEFRHSKGEYRLQGLQGMQGLQGLQGPHPTKAPRKRGTRKGGARPASGGGQRQPAAASPLPHRVHVASAEADGGRAGGGREGGRERGTEGVSGLREEEMQFLVCLLGEHLNEEQVQAIFASLDFSATPLLPFEPGVAKILRFMNPRSHDHRRDVKQLGSILDHDPTAAAVEEEASFFLDEEDLGPANAVEWAKTLASRALHGVDEIRMGRSQRRAAAKARKTKEAKQFTTWFDAMGNNQDRMRQELQEAQMHFG